MCYKVSVQTAVITRRNCYVLNYEDLPVRLLKYTVSKALQIYLGHTFSSGRGNRLGADRVSRLQQQRAVYQ